jgi:hypothetical protein
MHRDCDRDCDCDRDRDFHDNDNMYGTASFGVKKRKKVHVCVTNSD